MRSWCRQDAGAPREETFARRELRVLIAFHCIALCVVSRAALHLLVSQMILYANGLMSHLAAKLFCRVGISATAAPKVSQS